MDLKSSEEFNLAELLELAWEYNLNTLSSISKIWFRVTIFSKTDTSNSGQPPKLNSGLKIEKGCKILEFSFWIMHPAR